MTLDTQTKNETNNTFDDAIEENWLVAYYYGESNTPLHYLGKPEGPFTYSEDEARQRAANLNAEIINTAQEEAFDGDLQIWRYVAVPMQSFGDRVN